MLTKRFKIWCQVSTPWMGAGAWDACALDYTEEDLAGMECYAGFDLSSTSDITSVSYAFPFDREIRLLTRHYLPEAQLLMESGANANIKPNKKKSDNKINPAVSALMAFGTFQSEHEYFAFDMSDNHKERLATFSGI
jgi:phage terminase large subunit-like protein